MGLLTAPTSVGALTDKTKQFADWMVDQTEDSDNKPLGQFLNDPVDTISQGVQRSVGPIVDKQTDKAIAAAKEKADEYAPIAIDSFAPSLSALAGGGLGGVLGYTAGSALSGLLGDDSYYTDKDGRKYRKRSWLKSLAPFLGAYAGAAGGGYLGGKYHTNIADWAKRLVAPAAPKTASVSIPYGTLSAPGVSSVKQAGSFKTNLGRELSGELSNSRPQNKPGFIPLQPQNPGPGAVQAIKNLPAAQKAMKAIPRGILPPENPAKGGK